MLPDHLLIDLESSDGDRGAILAPLLPGTAADESMAVYQAAADHGADSIVGAMIAHAVTSGELADCVWQVCGWRQITDQERLEEYPDVPLPATVINHAPPPRSTPRKRYRLQD